MKNQLVIFGTGPTATVTYWYFTEDSDFEVIAFTVNGSELNGNELLNLPIVPYESLFEIYPPSKIFLFIATGFGRLNEIKKKIYFDSKQKGYRFATYVHSGVKVWNTNKIGENTFIFEDNTLQPYAEIGHSVVLWSGNHIGHHAKIGDLCFITSHVVVSGFTQIGSHCYIGVNATLKDSLNIANNCIIGAGAIILSDTKENEVYPAERTKSIIVKSDRIRI
jgi:sugar O-acyltransferase (sialic acid O-acetyltransferase NeuD family)